jgi:ElaB/YqjD/DUF883 family membrane-anchored ribosome-binding protein
MEAGTQQRSDGQAGEQVTQQVQEMAGEVADQAREKAQDAGLQVQHRIRTEVDQRTTQAGERVGSTAEDLRAVGEELRNQGKESPAKIAEQAADRVEKASTYLRDADADRLLHDAEDLGRRQPWALLGAATLAGFAAARVLKASSSRRYSTRQLPSGQTNGTGATG